MYIYERFITDQRKIGGTRKNANAGNITQNWHIKYKVLPKKVVFLPPNLCSIGEKYPVCSRMEVFIYLQKNKHDLHFNIANTFI